jgi:anti-sigma factor RsiW
MDTNDPFVERLSDYLDDEDLDASERATIEAHLASCASCRTTLAELRQVATRAAALPVDNPPANELWTAIAARLGSGSVLPFAKSRPRRFSFTLPQLVAASLALIVSSGGVVWMIRLGDPKASLPPVRAEVTEAPIANVVDTRYDQAIDDLEKTLEANRSRLDPETVRVLEANLTAIDEAINQARKALRSDPANLYLNSHFAETRNRKLALLRRASALAMAAADRSGGS